MATEKAGGYISRMVFNDGTCLNIKKNDIVLFVGPNNAGKSQSLKDIYCLSAEKMATTIVADLTVSKYHVPISGVLEGLSSGDDQGRCIKYNVLGKTYNIFDFTNTDYLRDLSHKDYRDLFVANLDTAARLTICNPPKSISRGDTKKHPIHYAAFDKKYRKWLSDNYKRAFNEEVIPNIQYGATIPLCIGAPVKLDGEYDDEQERQEAFAEILDGYKQVHNQGDGIKSFTGILLYLMLDHFCTYLIDEPESFLHPPQAHIMGQIIGQTLTDEQQAFISTHSEDIIKGLIDVCPDRIKIIRITREGDMNKFSVLENEKFNDVWSDPLLKYSNIMSSLFHKSVVLCESDSDCRIYSVVESYLKQIEGKYSETLFIHCGGKHRMAKIVTALKSLNIPVKLVPDIDVMNDSAVFQGIVEAFGMEWSNIQRDYNVVVSNLHSAKEKIKRSEAKTIINGILEGSKAQDLSAKEIKGIQDAVRTISKWDGLKKGGTATLPAGDATKSFKDMDKKLREHGVYLVPVGELECFIKEVGGHGPEWANKVLENYPDLGDDVYKDVKDFIASLNL